MKQHPWNITPEELSEATSNLSPEERRDLVWAYNYSAAKNLGFPAFAAAAGISGDTLRRVASGTYIDPRDNSRQLPMPAGMADSISALRDACVAAQPGTVSFVSTDTSRAIAKHCDLARKSGTPVFMIGASQIGKSTGLGKYRDANPNDTWLITVTSGMGAKGLAYAICEELGVSPNGSLPVLTRRIGRTIPRTGLLIVDDFHVLTLASTQRTFRASMEFLRACYDMSKCGLLLSTTDLDYTAIHKEFSKILHQLLRRGVHHPNLGTQPQSRDVQEILEAHGLKWPAKSLKVDGVKPFSLLANLAMDSGLTVITERLRYALLFAARDAVPITWHHFVRADSAITANSAAPANDWLTEA
jgi:DNA transposition AAA+ family ATPase